MIYKVEQTVILDNGKIYPNMFYVLDKNFANFLKYITSDDENLRTYTYHFTNNLVRLYEVVDNHFKWQEYKISISDEMLIEEDELFILDKEDNYPRGKFIGNLQELMFEEITNEDSLNKILREVNKYLNK